MAALTRDEILIVSKLRSRLQDLVISKEQNSDMQLIRWIRARENDLDLAESMFRKSFKWREENDLEDILTWEPPEILKRLSPYDLNTDKDGFPVVIVSAGRVDLKRILQAGYMKEFIRYNIQTWERAMEKMKGRLTPDGVPMTQYVCVLDMEGLSMKYVASIKVIELIKTAIQNFESNYPEILGKCYVINVSRAFQILFGIAKPLMSGRTIQKIEIMTTEEKWKPVLLGVIDANQLPECYGGTASSNLHSLIGYSMKEKSDTFVEYNIPAGDVLQIPVKVSEENCKIKWNFSIDFYDIDIHVTFNEEKIVITERLESPKESVGILNCDSAGVYTFHFDNSYSKFRSKTVKSRIKIVTASKE